LFGELKFILVKYNLVERFNLFSAKT
jgi:hypothetical protein